MLAGRDDDFEHVLHVVERAAAGRFSMLVVAGDAGVGKTALVDAVRERVEDRMHVVAGAGLPLTTLSIPFLPLITGLRGWAARSGGTAPDLRQAQSRAGGVVVEMDAWLDRVCRERPLLLVVDDLQWADLSTLDLLTYVLAGPADRRLAVVLTVRDGHRRPGHHLHPWMADARRMPTFTTVSLRSLDRLGTSEQVAGLLGGPARESLVDDVFAHTGGNPYLTRLVVEPLAADAASLPSAPPATLDEAVLGPWHDLSAPARELTQVLAVGGAGQRPDRIREVAREIFGDGDVGASLAEAVDAGLLDVGDQGSYWFHHSLQAEVLVARTLPEQRRAWHAAHAAVLERAPASGGDDVDLVVAVADHHAHSDDPDQAYRWALRAAEAVGSVGGSAEQLRLLYRVLGLLPRIPVPDRTRAAVLDAIRDVAWRAGRVEDELAAIDLLLDDEGPARSGLDVAALLVRRMTLRNATGREFAGLDDVREAVRLTASAPESWQHAVALAGLARSELWRDDPSAAEHAAAAMTAARACGDPRALASALTSASMAMTFSGEPGGEHLAAEALAASVAAGDWMAFVGAATWTVNALENRPGRVSSEYLAERISQLTELGAPHAYVGTLCSNDADIRLSLGDWRGCASQLRVALGSTPGPMAEIRARLTAATLAASQGRAREAEAHLHRAEENSAETSTFLGLGFDWVRAEVALAARDPERALAAAMTGARAAGRSPDGCERLLPLAARALADLVEARTDAGRSGRAALGELEALRRELPRVIQDFGTADPDYTAHVRAMQALYDAEVLRARRAPDAGDSWTEAADLCDLASLPWQAAYAHCRAAESLVAHRARRADGVDRLRRAHRLATELGARPLVDRLEALARSTRTRLAGASPGAAPAERSASIAGLTPREEEVLTLVVSGRTYGEIARELVISEKTVSVHISNLLRKTATANRIELAAMVQRRSAG